MDHPSKPGASAAAHDQMDSKPQPAYPPPVTGIPVGQTSQYYSNQNQQSPFHLHQQQQQQQQQHRHHGLRTSWSSGLCDCCSDIPTCCLTCWCPCITFGRIAEIVDKGKTPCAVSGAIYGMLMWFTCCSCLYSCLYRSKLRNEYILEESPCNDCLVHCCCESCSLCQEYRELKHRGYDMAAGWQENLQRPSGTLAPSAPVVEQGMTR